MIISASRRTDIPAFYTEWFSRRLREGFVYVKNPYSGKVYQVSLRPGDVHSVVFWSKDFSPLLSRLGEVEAASKNLFFHCTITGAPKDIEPIIPDYRSAISDLRHLSGRYSPGHVVWRFDPIVITDKISYACQEEAFIKCAELLKGAVERCFISFMEPYKKVLRGFGRHGNHVLASPSPSEKKAFAARLAGIAERYGIKIYACCSEALLSDDVQRASCIDGPYLSRLFGDYNLDSPPAPTRAGCGCTRSVDIGAYDTCPHGCLYCYANSGFEKAARFRKEFDPEWNGLGFNVEGG